MRHKTTDIELAEFVAASTSMADLLRNMGLRPTGGSTTHYKNRINKAGIDFSHFIGQSWARGLNLPKREIDSILIVVPEGSPRTQRTLLLRAMKEVGVVYACSTPECPIKDGTWLGKPITLYIDHVDGNWLDNRIENLRFLCFNCHIQTSTFGNKKRRPVGKLEKSEGLEPSSRDHNPVAGSTPVGPTCVDCGKTISKISTRCKSCSGKFKEPTKINWPPQEELLDMLEKSNYTQVGKQLGVSDNAIRKHLKVHYKTPVLCL